MSEGMGAIGTICGGGRYNGLVEEVGGNDVPGIGYAFSLERVTLALKANNIDVDLKDEIDVYVITLGETARMAGSKILQDLRRNNISADMDYMNRKMKAQMKAADRLQANYTIIIGEDEIKNNQVIIRNMKSGEQEEVTISNITERLIEKF